MEDNRLSIEQVFENSNKVTKKKSSITLSILLIVLGLISFFLSSQASETADSIINPLFIVLGIILLTWGIITIFFRKNQYRTNTNNQKVTFHELFFDIKERDKLIRIIKERNINELKNVQPSANDALKLRAAYTPDGTICYTQVITYIPFEFVNASDAYENTPEQAKVIMELVKSRD